MTKVAIIGAGPCGLSMLRYVELAEKNGEKIPELVSIEKKKKMILTISEQLQKNYNLKNISVLRTLFGKRISQKKSN